VRGWADRNSTALIICGTIILLFLLVYLLYGLNTAEGEGGISTVIVTNP
jgi:hypothetical protein